MKLTRKIAPVAGALFLACSVQAQTVAPAPPAPTPARGIGGFGGAAPAAANPTMGGGIAPGGFGYRAALPATERGTYLGVLTSPVSAALREQLRLPRGAGLIVDHVETDSPADQAGLKQYDILQKLEDQLLINNQQLMVLVRMYKPQDQIKFQIIRQGQPMTVSARLVEGDVPPIDDNNPWGLNPANIHGDVFRAPGAYAPTAVHALATTVDGRGVAQTRFADGKYELAFVDGNGKRILQAIDARTGKTIYSGPIDTPEQQKALPAEIEQRLRALEENARLNKLEFNAAVRQTHSAQQSLSISYADDDVQLQITRKNGVTRLQASGKFTFDGPIDTAQEREKIPQGLRDKLRQVMDQQKKTGGAVVDF